MKILLYPHGGSGNHGCEAIIRTIRDILHSATRYHTIILASYDSRQERRYGVDTFDEIIEFDSLPSFSFANILGKLWNDLFKKVSIRNRRATKPVCKRIDSQTVCISIGGDMYSYKGVIPYNVLAINHKAKKAGQKLVLWGCSIGEDCLDKPIIQDLKSYDLIIARESITFESLIKINPDTMVFPDPAFTLKPVMLELPVGFVESNTVGINISPLIVDCEQTKGTTMQNYVALIEHILDTTDMQIALIPHVVWESNDDRIPIRELYTTFQKSPRVIQLEDHNTMELKGYISRCRLFIGARTHATIAAYSSCVPTLAVGYSVKAKGIAKDIFGTYENYVVPVQTLANTDDLITAFKWLRVHEEDIRQHLNIFMPTYIKKAAQAGDIVYSLMGE